MKRLPIRGLAPLFCAMLLAGAARGDSFTVDSTADPGAEGENTLRNAVEQANANMEADTIDFDLASGSIILLTSSLDAIKDDLDIDGSTASGLLLRGTASFLSPDVVVEGGTTALREIELFLVSLEVLQDATLVLDSGSGTMTAFGTILIGDGSLTKEGTGTLELAGDGLFFVGTTTVSEGTLQTDAATIQGDIVNNATVAFVQNAAGTQAGIISGSGTLVKKGPQTLVLTGANTYSGGTTVEEGTLEGTTTSLQGNFQLDADTTLRFDQDVDGTLSGNVDGDGALEKLGSGTLTLTGTNLYSGGTTIGDGTVRGSSSSLPGDIAIGTDGALVFDQVTPGIFDGVLSGDGSLEKEGAESLTLTGDSSGFSGETTVTAGSLLVDGSLGGSGLTVGVGGTLGGIGTLMSDVLVSGGIAPGGDEIGTLTIEGNAVLASTATLAVQVQETGDGVGIGDLLDVTGDITLNGPSMTVRPGDGLYLTPVEVVVIEASFISGDFSGLSEDLAFVDATFMTGANQVLVTVFANDNSFVGFAETENQAAVGAVLDDARVSRNEGVVDLLAAFNTLTVEEVPDALDAVAGERLTTFFTPRLAVERRLDRALDNRIRGFAAGDPHVVPSLAMTAPALRAPTPSAAAGLSGFAALAAAAPAVSAAPAPGESGVGAWLDGFAVLGSLDDSDPYDITYDIFGASLGVDYRFGESFLVGAAFGYAYTDIDVDDLRGDQDMNSYLGALYGSFVADRFHLGAHVSFGGSDMDSERRILFGSLDRTAKADIDGWSVSTHLESGYDAVGFGGFLLQPLASFDYSHLEQDSFTEKDAGSASLKIDSESIDSLVTGLGLRLHGTFEMDDDAGFTPEIGALWTHEFGDTDRKLDANLTGAGSAGDFVLRGAEMGRDALLGSAGYTVSLAGNLNLYANYQILWNPDVTDHGFAAGFHFAW